MATAFEAGASTHSATRTIIFATTNEDAKINEVVRAIGVEPPRVAPSHSACGASTLFRHAHKLDADPRPSSIRRLGELHGRDTSPRAVPGQMLPCQIGWGGSGAMVPSAGAGRSEGHTS